MSLRVAVTGPTGEIGISTIEALERHPDVDADRRNGAAAVRSRRTRLDEDRVPAGRHPRPRRRRRLVADVDVVVHLAFIIMGTREESAQRQPGRHPQRLRGDRGRPGPRRLVYTSSVAAYGYHADNPVPITEDVADARIARALLLRTEGRVRRGARRDHRGLARWRCTCCGRASSPDPRRPRWPMPCRGINCPGRCVESRRQCRCSSRRSRIPARRCSWCTTTTSPSAIALAVTTTTAPPGCVQHRGRRPAVDVRRRLPRWVPGRSRVPRAAAVVTSEVLIARLPFVPSALEWLHAGRDFGGDGYQQGQVRARMAAEIYCCPDAFGIGRHPSLSKCPRTQSAPSAWISGHAAAFCPMASARCGPHRAHSRTSCLGPATSRRSRRLRPRWC